MLRADYFDGRSTRVRVVSISAAGDTLIIAGEDIDLCVAFSDVTIDERLGRAPRRLRLAGGSFCEVRDLDGLDQLLSSMGHVDGRVDRMQRQVPVVLLSFAAFLVLAFGAYVWILPWAAARAARQLPPAIGRTLSLQTMKVLDGGILLPSKVSDVHRAELIARFHALRLPGGGTAESPLLFRRSAQLGANAFTLPDSTIIVLDDLIELVKDDRRMMAVLAHELGHAHGHHGLQLLLQSSAIGVFLSFYIGDISQLLAAAPAALLQAKYSQDLERQADDYGAAVLLNNGMSPLLLADALADLAKSHPGPMSGAYLASHPSTDERISHLRELAAHGGQ